jgi:molybdopterin converting factor small subunit
MVADHVGQLLQALKDRVSDGLFHVDRLYDETGQLRPSVIILINGQNMRFLEGLETELSDGDEVYIMPVIGGG